MPAIRQRQKEKETPSLRKEIKVLQIESVRDIKEGQLIRNAKNKVSIDGQAAIFKINGNLLFGMFKNKMFPKSNPKLQFIPSNELDLPVFSNFQNTIYKDIKNEDGEVYDAFSEVDGFSYFFKEEKDEIVEHVKFIVKQKTPLTSLIPINLPDGSTTNDMKVLSQDTNLTLYFRIIGVNNYFGCKTAQLVVEKIDVQKLGERIDYSKFAEF